MRRHRSSGSLSRWVLTLLATGLVAAGCTESGGDDDDADDGGGAPAATAEFRAEAAMACTDAVNARDAGFTDGLDEMLAAVVALHTDGGIPAGSVDTALMGDVVEELSTTRDLLAEVDAAEATAEEAEAWDSVIAAIDERAAWIDGRIAAIDGGVPTEVTAAFETIAPVGIDAGTLDVLGMTGLDCELVLDGAGPDGDTFLIEAATACATAAQRLRAPAVAEARSTVLDAVLQVASEGSVQPDDALVEATEVVATAARTAVEDLAALDVTGDRADRADRWAVVVDSVAVVAATFDARTAALQDGGEDDIATAFAPEGSAANIDPRGAADSLGLGQRDCRSLG